MTAIASPENQRNSAIVGPMTFALPRIAVVLLLAAPLAGCLTSTSQPAQTAEERCAARGHPPDSAALRDCIASVEAPRERRLEERRREMLERSNMPAAATR